MLRCQNNPLHPISLTLMVLIRAQCDYSTDINLTEPQAVEGSTDDYQAEGEEDMDVDSAPVCELTHYRKV